jgi:glycerol dehydrogenase-like iron-containing ADH family enzyme
VLETDILEAVQQSLGLLKQKVSGVNTSVAKLQRKETKIVLFGNSHGRGMGPMFQENVGSKFEVYSTYKPNAPLAKVDEDVRKLGKDLTKKDHIVIVGGAGKNLDINQYYSTAKDLNSLQRGQVTQMCDL